VVGGSADSLDESVMARYNADGTPDTAFGQAGLVQVASPNFFIARALAVEPDGHILVAGQNADEFILARYGADGFLDTAFGTGGLVETPFPGWDASIPQAIALTAPTAAHPNGEIVVAGETDQYSSGVLNVALAEYDDQGHLDTSFGTNGLVTTAFGSTDDEGSAVAVQPDGKIVPAGYSYQDDTSSDIALARFNPDGSLDASFGSSGVVTSAALPSAEAEANGVALEPDGKIVVAGNAYSNSAHDQFAVAARYLGDPQVTVAIDPTASPATVSANLQNVVTFLQDNSTYTTPPPIDLPVTPTTLETAVTAVNSLSAPTVPINITLDLGDGTVGDTTVSPPPNVTLVINGAGGSTTFVGQPAPTT
jgi:uncharacterized delta-60 repeat protein